LSESLQTDYKTTLQLTYLIFLKGAANKGAPESLSATTITHNGTSITLKKEYLLTAYKTQCRNTHLRRLADRPRLATHISEWPRHLLN
jgi:hypothetical protein